MHVMFPWALLKQTSRFWLAGQSIGAQQSISGAFTVIPSLSAHWRAAVGFIAHTEAQYLQARGFLAQMEGMIGTTDVPCPAWFRPVDARGREVTMSSVAGLWGAQTMEHWGFENAPIEAASLIEAAPVRATQIKVDFAASTGLRPGHRFSIAGNLYEVQLTWADQAGDSIVQFQPPLRAAAAIGEPVEIHHPTCKMRLASADEREADDTPVPARFFTLNFIEAL